MTDALLMCNQQSMGCSAFAALLREADLEIALLIAAMNISKHEHQAWKRKDCAVQRD